MKNKEWEEIVAVAVMDGLRGAGGRPKKAGKKTGNAGGFLRSKVDIPKGAGRKRKIEGIKPRIAIKKTITSTGKKRINS